MRLILFLVVFFQLLAASADSYSFLESYLDPKAYKEFQYEQRRTEKVCGHISATYRQFYGEELDSCEILLQSSTVIARGPHGELSKAELEWLKQALNLSSPKTKLSFIMSEYLVRENLVPHFSFAIDVEFLF